MFRTIVCAIVVLGFSKLAQQSPLSVDDPALCNDTDEMCAMRKQLRNVMEQLNRLAEDEDDDNELSPKKRKSSYVRFGKRSDEEIEPEAVEKRKSSYVRFGKRSGVDDYDANEVNKRKSSYVRFGRSGNDMHKNV